MGGHPRRIITISIIIIIMTIIIIIKIIIIIIIIFLPREIMWVVSTRVVDASALQAAPSVKKKNILFFTFILLFPFFHAGSPMCDKNFFCFFIFSYILLVGVAMQQSQVFEIFFISHFFMQRVICNFSGKNTLHHYQKNYLIPINF